MTSKEYITDSENDTIAYYYKCLSKNDGDCKDCLALKLSLKLSINISFKL